MVNIDRFIKTAEKLNLTLLPNEEIKPGDLYLACEFHSPKLLTCESVNLGGWIVPTDYSAYRYEVYHCVKVKRNQETENG